VGAQLRAFPSWEIVSLTLKESIVILFASKNIKMPSMPPSSNISEFRASTSKPILQEKSNGFWGS
jgi:hypothetical protein